MPKVSVIVPIYGVEKYIEKCARSLFEQVLDDIEYLFIDDCTPDRSVALLQRVLEDYPHRKSQVLIHRMKHNCGQAAVRTWGMKHATGDYVIHCDSDDWVDRDMYKEMFDKAVEEEADVVVCDICIEDSGHQRLDMGVEVNDKKHLLRSLINYNDWSLCDKLVKRDIIVNNSIIYPTGVMGEDLMIATQILFYSKKTITIRRQYYHYLYNPASITKNKSSHQILKNFYEVCDNLVLLDGFVKETKMGKDNRLGMDYLKFSRRNTLLPLVGDKKYYQEWKLAFPEINYRILFNPFVTAREKLRYILFFLRLKK